MFAVIGRSLYYEADPSRFASVTEAAFRVFQLITLENWSDTILDNRVKAPTIYAFVAFTIVILNLIFVKYPTNLYFLILNFFLTKT